MTVRDWFLMAGIALGLLASEMIAWRGRRRDREAREELLAGLEELFHEARRDLLAGRRRRRDARPN